MNGQTTHIKLCFGTATLGCASEFYLSQPLYKGLVHVIASGIIGADGHLRACLLYRVDYTTYFINQDVRTKTRTEFPL